MRNKIDKALAARTLGYFVQNDRTILKINIDIKYVAQTLRYVEILITRLIKFPVVPYQSIAFLSHTAKNSIKAGPADLIQQLISIDASKIYWYFPNHEFSPYLNALDMVRTSLNTKFWFDEIPVTALNHNKVHSLFNTFLETIKGYVNHQNFKKALDNHENAARKNHLNLIRYFDALHNKYKKLHVVHLGLGYQPNHIHYHESLGYGTRQYRTTYSNSDIPLPSHLDAASHRQKFFKSLDRYVRNNPFEQSLVGYVWKTDHNLLQSYHFHALIFLKFHGKHPDTELTGEFFKEHWKSFAGDNAIVYNPWKSELRYMSTWSKRDETKKMTRRAELNAAALFLTKTDYYVRLKPAPGVRIFGKGILPKQQRPST